MLTFLFWNLKSKNIAVLTNLVRHHNVDVLVLAECPMIPGTILPALNRSRAEYFFAPCDCDKLQLYTRFSDRYVLPVKRGNAAIKGADYTFRKLALPGKDELLLCAVHFPSKLRQQNIDQVAFAMRFANVLADAEEAVAHERTLLVGDLNMNPYDDAVVTTTGLHAVPTRRIAKKETRRVKFESNLFFFQSHVGALRGANTRTRG